MYTCWVRAKRFLNSHTSQQFYGTSQQFYDTSFEEWQLLGSVFLKFLRKKSNVSYVFGPFSQGRWSEVSQLVEDDLLSKEEVAAIFRDLPKAGGRASIDLKGFVAFASKVTCCFRALYNTKIYSSHWLSKLF